MAKITKISPFAGFGGKKCFSIEGVEYFTCNIGLYKHKHDLMVVHFKKAASVGGLFTLSKMCSDPVLWCKKNIYGENIFSKFAKLLSGKISPTSPIIANVFLNALAGACKFVGGKIKVSEPQCSVLIVNSGCSNTYTGENGMKIIKAAVQAACKQFGCGEGEVFVSSTGVIGQYFDTNLIANAIANEVLNLKPLAGTENFLALVKATETTDTFSKIYGVQTQINGKNVNISGIIKGSGMIEPNMATMLGYIFCDANISSGVLQKMMNEFKDETFNSITVDSDSSTSDTVLAFASGTGGGQITNYNDPALTNFKAAFKDVMLNLAKLVVMDGEGASKFITIKIEGAKSYRQAKVLGKSIANSPLVKTAIAGGDANWGRIAMALGKTLENIDRNKISITFGNILVAKNWQKCDYNEQDLTKYLINNQFIEISVDINLGHNMCVIYTCDLTHEYIAINGDYRS